MLNYRSGPYSKIIKKGKKKSLTIERAFGLDIEVAKDPTTDVTTLTG